MLLLSLCAVKQDIAVMVKNLRVHDRLLVNAAIGDCCIRSAHFVIINTVRDTA